jgi:hypothetical protein
MPSWQPADCFVPGEAGVAAGKQLYAVHSELDSRKSVTPMVQALSLVALILPATAIALAIAARLLWCSAPSNSCRGTTDKLYAAPERRRRAEPRNSLRPPQMKRSRTPWPGTASPRLRQA